MFVRVCSAVLPQEPLHIEGGEPTYEIEHLINLTCVSGASYPTQQLTWYINDQKVPKQVQSSKLSN